MHASEHYCCAWSSLLDHLCNTKNNSLIVLIAMEVDYIILTSCYRFEYIHIADVLTEGPQLYIKR